MPAKPEVQVVRAFGMLVFNTPLPPGDVRDVCLDNDVVVLVTDDFAGFALRDNGRGKGTDAAKRPCAVLAHAWTALLYAGKVSATTPPAVRKANAAGMFEA